MNKDLEKKLLEDLDKTGFGSEMRSIRAINAAGWTTNAGAAYFDHDASITRNIDVVAVKLARNFELELFFEYHLFIEVKKSEKPWVVFREKDRFPDHGDAWNNPYFNRNAPVQLGDLTPKIRTYSIRNGLGWLGYGVHEAFKKPQDTGRWYGAAVTACKACYDYVRHESFSSLKDEPSGYPFLMLTHPVVVLDGPLTSAELNDEGEVTLEEIRWAPFEFEFSTEKYSAERYRVDLVSLDAIPEFLKILDKRVEEMFVELYDARRIKLRAEQGDAGKPNPAAS